jgi:DNA polymerase-3 subunit delta'
LGRRRSTVETAETRVSAISEEQRQSPEPDRLPGFAHPREASNFFGNPAAEQNLLDAIRSNRLHHAWLIKGAEGIGKATLAYRLARFMLSSGPEKAANARDLSVPRDNPVFGKVAALSHPNLLVLRRPWQEARGRFAQQITVGEVRRLKSFLGNTAAMDGWRIVILDRAEDMNANASNALLKALEEPPPRCIFLLVSATPGRLPVTIRSRCRRLKLEPLGPSALADAVGHAFEHADLELPGGTDLSRSLELAEGSVGYALQLLSRNGLQLYDQVFEALASMPHPDYAALHALADQAAASGDQNRFELTLAMLEGIIARLIRQSALGEGAIGEEAALAGRLIGARGLAPWAELWETLRRAKAETLALNLDRKSFVLGTFFRLEETTRLEMASGT